MRFFSLQYPCSRIHSRVNSTSAFSYMFSCILMVEREMPPSFSNCLSPLLTPLPTRQGGLSTKLCVTPTRMPWIPISLPRACTYDRTCNSIRMHVHVLRLHVEGNDNRDHEQRPAAVTTYIQIICTFGQSISASFSVSPPLPCVPSLGRRRGHDTQDRGDIS